MLRFFSLLTLIFGNAFSQITPIRNPILPNVPIATTIGPALTIGPIRTIGTIGPIRTRDPFLTTSTSTTISTSTSSNTSSIFNFNNTDPESGESEANYILVYIFVPIGIILIMLCYFCIYRTTKKRPVINNHLVNIDLNIENTITEPRVNNETPRQLSNHVYEEIDYEARYEMPTIRTYENATSESEYGTQVTSMI
tara:strand:- start:1090 stop:1677 length:588 start_codon:yes stop_codon:yes gene_type:complete